MCSTIYTARSTTTPCWRSSRTMWQAIKVRHGCSMTTFSFTRNESSSRWHPHRCQPYWRPPTWDMKGSNVCFTALEQILISRAPRRWFRNTSACARFASETNMSTSIQPTCYNCCSYRPMDFVEGLPHVHSKSVILTVNDWFSNFSHFILLGHSYTATSVVQAFFTEVVQIYLMPNSIVSNRDLVVDKHVLARALSPGQSKTQPQLGVPPIYRATANRRQQPCHWVPELFNGASASPLALLAYVGGILLQFGILVVPPNHAVPRRLWTAAAGSQKLRQQFCLSAGH